VTTRNFPAALAGLIVNVVLIVLLVPTLGIAGAGIALCGAYVVMIGVMHLLTRRAFAASFEWRRLAQLAVVLGGMSVAGDLLLPTHGLVGFISRAAVLAAMPLVLTATGFTHLEEREQAKVLLARARRGIAREPA
jgi:O-antigen/teichoic acid export membrane protein